MMGTKMLVGIGNDVVEAGPEQVDYVVSWQADAEATRRQEIVEEEARLDARKSAISKLQALGLTLDEVQAAFGLQA